MKRHFVLLSTILVLSAMIVVPVFATKDVTGNGAPSGKHYNLNVIGVPNQKNANFDGGQGSRIFILRTGVTQVYVHGGTSYAVLDHDGTDGVVGTDRLNPGLILPYDAGADPTWRVKIYVRLLGPVDSSIKWKVEYWDGSEWVLISEFTLNREKPAKFSLKNSQILADGFEDILWTWDEKQNFRIMQMRLYLMD